MFRRFRTTLTVLIALAIASVLASPRSLSSTECSAEDSSAAISSEAKRGLRITGEPEQSRR